MRSVPRGQLHSARGSTDRAHSGPGIGLFDHVPFLNWDLKREEALLRLDLTLYLEPLLGSSPLSLDERHRSRAREALEEAHANRPPSDRLGYRAESCEWNVGTSRFTLVKTADQIASEAVDGFAPVCLCAVPQLVPSGQPRARCGHRVRAKQRRGGGPRTRSRECPSRKEAGCPKLRISTLPC